MIVVYYSQFIIGAKKDILYSIYCRRRMSILQLIVEEEEKTNIRQSNYCRRRRRRIYDNRSGWVSCKSKALTIPWPLWWAKNIMWLWSSWEPPPYQVQTLNTPPPTRKMGGTHWSVADKCRMSPGSNPKATISLAAFSCSAQFTHSFKLVSSLNISSVGFFLVNATLCRSCTHHHSWTLFLTIHILAPYI